MKKNLTKFARCYRSQCAAASLKPCWLRKKDFLKRGVNVHGFFSSEIGLGESARLLYKALSAQGVAVAACNRVLDDRQNEESFRDLLSNEAPYNVGIVVDGLVGFKRLRRQICDRKLNIAYPFWELEKIPQEYIKFFKKYHRVWAPSNFILEALKRHGVSNVELAKHPFELPDTAPQPRSGVTRLKILFYFDFDSSPLRKNPEAAVLAFKQAFRNREDVALTVKVHGRRDAGRRNWLAQHAADDQRITIIDRLLDRKSVSALMARHDVFLSLHRSEGVGLGCAEAIAAGKVVVATDYGGSTDFINAKTGFPVEWSRISVDPEGYVLADNATWADPSIDHAAEILKIIYDDPSAAHKKTASGFRHLVENHSFNYAGINMAALLRDALSPL